MFWFINEKTASGGRAALFPVIKVRIERRIEDGSVAVFFDDMKKPIMKARDQTFTKGLVGFGSFDDTGRFRNMRLYADKTDKARISFLTSP